MKNIIGLLGITGNPPHLGHLRLALEALNYCEEVWISPVYIHPFNKTSIEYRFRLDMLKILFFEFTKIKILELDKEFYLKYNKIPYSYNLLSCIKEKNNFFQPTLIIGEDNYKEEIWKKFYRYQDIEKDFGLIVIKDFGFHSTQIRESCQKQNKTDIEYMCGHSVANYIFNENLYQ